MVTPTPQPVVHGAEPAAGGDRRRQPMVTGGTGGGTGTGGTGGGAGTGTPVTLTGIAGGYLDTGNQGVAKGFTSMLWTYADAQNRQRQLCRDAIERQKNPVSISRGHGDA